MPRFLLYLVAALTLPLFASAALTDEAKPSHPNVLLFFIDDMGSTDLSVNGSTFHETPHIDTLAASGVNFTNAYSANPVCSPTRAALMTGKAPQRVGITQWISSAKVNLPLSEITVAEAFLESGYRTAYFGKWHLGKNDEFMPDRQGFEYIRGVNRAGHPASYFYPFKKNKKGRRTEEVPDLESYPEDTYLTDALTDEAIKFIQQKSAKPFFLCLSHYAVHTPIQAPKPLVEKYAAKKTKLYGDDKQVLIKEKYGTVTMSRQDNPSYAGMLENLDTNIGRVVEQLKRQGLLENTIVVFTSDNGGLSHRKRGATATCNAPFRSGKGWTYEGGTRIPLIVSWAGQIQPATTEARTITMDLYPTLLELCSLPLKPLQHLDGKSLKQVLAGEQDEAVEKRFLAWTYPHKHGNGHRPSDSILSGDWKLIRFQSDEPAELYNLVDDIGEKNNLAKQNPEKVQELKAMLDKWLSETTH